VSFGLKEMMRGVDCAWYGMMRRWWWWCGAEEEGDGGILGLAWVNGGVMGMMMKYGCSDDVIYGGEEGRVWLGLVIRVSFFLSSLDFSSLKTSSSSPTLEILAQLNNYGNNIFHNYYFWTVVIAKRVKPELRRLAFFFLF